jgi:hypothetical protein
VGNGFLKPTIPLNAIIIKNKSILVDDEGGQHKDVTHPTRNGGQHKDVTHPTRNGGQHKDVTHSTKDEEGGQPRYPPDISQAN